MFRGRWFPVQHRDRCKSWLYCCKMVWESGCSPLDSSWTPAFHWLFKLVLSLSYLINSSTFYHPTGDRFGTRLLLSHLHDVFPHCHNPILMSTFCSCRYVTFYIVSITLLLYHNFVLLVYLQQEINPEILKSDSSSPSSNPFYCIGLKLGGPQKTP